MKTERFHTFALVSLISVLTLTLTACAEKAPNKETQEGDVAVTTAKAPSCNDTPAPTRCTESTPTYGRATRLTQMEIANDTSITVAGVRLTNGLNNLATAAKNANPDNDMNKSLKEAIENGKVSVVIEVPNWAQTNDTPPSGAETLYLWLGTDKSGNDIKIDPKSVDKGSYPKGAVKDILFEKVGTNIKVKTSAPQSTHLNMSIAGMNLPIDIEGAELSGTVVPQAEGLVLKNASLVGGIGVNSFKKGILEIVKKCGSECYSTDENKLTCNIANDPTEASNACVTHLQSLDSKLQKACKKMKDFCSDKAKLGLDLFSSGKTTINGKKVIGAKFKLTGEPIHITGISATSSL